jgi:5-methyltetrahydrofolate--homocysteine methyltransferase
MEDKYNMELLQEINNAVVAGNRSELNELTRKALSESIAPMDIIKEGMIKGLDVVGEKFENKEMFLPEMMMSALAVKGGVEIATEGMKSEDFEPKATMVIGTVKGDMHDIGKNLVAMMLEVHGYKVVDLGVDVGTEKIIEAINEHKPEFLGLSALLTTCIPEMRNTLDALKENGMRDSLKIVIGGPPINQELADQLGADGYARDAQQGVKLLGEWLG